MGPPEKGPRPLSLSGFVCSCFISEFATREKREQRRPVKRVKREEETFSGLALRQNSPKECEKKFNGHVVTVGRCDFSGEISFEKGLLPSEDKL